MIETKIILTIKHTRPIPDLCDLVAGRAYTLSHVEDVTAEVVEQAECRSDGRCQYAIDHGTEGLGHCPKGKCVLPEQPQAEAVPDGYALVPIMPTKEMMDAAAHISVCREDVWREMLLAGKLCTTPKDVEEWHERVTGRKPHQLPKPSPNEWVLE